LKAERKLERSYSGMSVVADLGDGRIQERSRLQHVSSDGDKSDALPLCI
jgi:hypothetical protein